MIASPIQCLQAMTVPSIRQPCRLEAAGVFALRRHLARRACCGVQGPAALFGEMPRSLPDDRIDQAVLGSGENFSEADPREWGRARGIGVLERNSA